MQAPSQLDPIAKSTVDAAFTVHKTLGPGLLESVYQQCLHHELTLRGLRTLSQVTLPITYRDIKIEPGFKIDLLIQDSLIVEIKAVERLLPVHEAQLLTYLKLANKRLGLLINFNVPILKLGIKRLAL